MAIDVEKHINYWRSGAEEDLAAARALLHEEHVRQALFLAHLAIDKILKAHVTRHTKRVPPRTHNLTRLCDIAGLAVSPEQGAFLRAFGMYQTEGRYPDAAQVPLDLETARKELSSAQEMVTWLTAKL